MAKVTITAARKLMKKSRTNNIIPKPIKPLFSKLEIWSSIYGASVYPTTICISSGSTSDDSIASASAIKASEIFMKYNIDFCCGGDRKLITAIEEQQLDEDMVLNDLNTAFQEFKNKVEEDVDWRTKSMSELIEHINNTHHQYMRETLPSLNDFLLKILNAHYLNHREVLSKIHKLFYKLRGEIEEHLIKEEQILFPLIKEYEKNPSEDKLNEVIKVMEETEGEHDNAGDILKELRRLTNHYELPESACKTFALTYEKFVEMESDLFEHIHLENNILFEKLKANK